MSEESKTYQNIDRAKMDRLRSAISNYVALPEGDAGGIESEGMRGRYLYDPAAQTLTLTLEEVPFFIPRAMIWSTIERALES
jgi:hypothetical protein